MIERRVRVNPKAQPIVQQVAVSRCPCGSMRRAPYSNVQTLDYAGETRDGVAYSQVVWRRTRCLDCGQVRVDKSFE